MQLYRKSGKESAHFMKKIGFLHFEPPTKTYVIINLREAMEMGLKIPFDLLITATRVIQ